MKYISLFSVACLAACSRPTGDFGITAEHPLGTVEKIDAYLKGTIIEKKGPRDYAADPSVKEIYYDDPKSMDLDMYWNASVFIDAQGKIVRMEARFRDKRNRTSVLMEMFQDYWKRLTGGEPKLQKPANPTSAEVVDLATHSSATVDAKWTMVTQEGYWDHKVELKRK
jgi:major membrane immunogen (membrane-anchored lipoprotein)